MKKLLRLFAALCFVMLCWLSQRATAQISATLNIRTPAPPQLSTWINDRTVVQLIVINRGAAAIPNCRASFFIRNIENGNIIIRSNDNSGAVPVFTIPAGISTTTFFGRDLVSEQAITYDQNLIATAVTTNSIPEGSYEFCVRILNAAGQAIAEAPCRTFTVLIPDPPSIVSPVDNAELLTTAPPTFVWTPVQFVSNVRYNLRIAPLFAGQNRRQAIESNPPLLNQTGIVGTSFFYNPSLPSFSLYAQAIGWVWQVQAVNSVGAPITRNEGRSEIGQFKFKPPVAQNQPQPVTPAPSTPTIQPPAPQLPLPFQPTLQPPVLQNSVLKGRIVYTYFGAPKVEPTGERPLKNTPIKLSLYRYAENFSGPNTDLNPGEYGEKWNQVGRKERPAYIKTLATTTTDANGNYTFSFVQTDSTGYRGKKTLQGSVYGSFTYDEFITTRIEVENPYFTSPDNNLMIQPKQIIDLSGSQAGTLVARVRTFDLTLTVKTRNVSEDQGAANQGVTIKGAKVYVLRESVPANLPQEGNAAGAPNLGTVLLGKQADSEAMSGDAEKFLFNLKVVSIGETDAQGKVTFKLIRNLSPNDHYIIWANMDSANAINYRFLAQKFTSRGKWSPTGAFVSATPEDKDAKWNNEYPNYSQCQREMTLFGVPSQPKVGGVVYFEKNETQPVENATVDLIHYVDMFKVEKTQITSGNGYFNFSDLPTTIGEFGVGKSKELIRIVRITRPGYKEAVRLINNGASLQRGQRQWLGKVMLEPKATVKGSVVDAETGEGVSATVTFQDGAAVQTTKMFSGNVSQNVGSGISLSPSGGFMGVGSVGGVSGGMVNVREVFTAAAPTGNNIRVIVRPNNQNYFSPETLFVNIPSNVVTLEPFKVYQKKRRIQIRVLEQVSLNPNQNLQANKPISALKVTITNLPNQPSVLTDAQGIARFEPFFNASNAYTIRVETTNNPRFQTEDFLTRENTYNGVFVESKSYISQTVFLPRAGRISGRVLVGRSRPVEGARVRLVSSGSNVPVETFTDANGNYTLRKIPLGQGLQFRAAKSQSQLVGTDTTLNVTGTHANINFVLREYNDMDITKLWGFPIEVDDLREQAGQVRIDGSFVAIPDNSQFKLMDDDNALAFANVPLEPIAGSDNGKGIPFARPKNAQIVITDKNLFREVRVYNFLAKVFDPSGLKVAPLENDANVGAVRGRVYVRRSSFTVSTGSLDFVGSSESDTAFYLLRPDKSGAERLVIPALAANAQPAVNAPQGFQIGDATGGNFKFKLYGFESEAENASSFLLGESAKLKTRLHTAFTNVSPADINLDIGAVEVKMNGVQPISGTAKIAIPLGSKWTLESSDWALSAQSGFTLKTGAVKTGGVDIGFTGIKVEPTRLETTGGATYNFSNLPVAGGIATMKTMQGSAAQLGYDPGQQKWSFAIGKGSNQYATFIENLPNCAPSDQLLFENVTLFSDGTSGYTLKSAHPELTVYAVAKFKPAQANLYEDLIQLSGQVNYGIPLLQPITTLLRFQKQGGSVVASVAPAEFEIKPNAVTMKFPNAEGAQTLDATGFTAKGKIYEIVQGGKKMFEFNLTLRKTPNGVVTATLDAGQTFNFSEGKSQLKNLTGGLKPLSQSAWEQFKFEGDVESDDGISGRLAFVVTGDIQTDIGNQKVSVKNIDMPFGQLSITYDFALKRLQGSISVDMEQPNAYKLLGSADVRFDPKGWFFAAYGTIELNNPNISFALAIVFGDYPNISSISEIQTKFGENNWKPAMPEEMRTIPTSYNNLKGFYFLGEATNFLGITLPKIEVDLEPVVSCSVEAYYGMGLSLGMNFASGKQFRIGAAVFAGITASVGASIGIACGGGSLTGLVRLFGIGDINLSNGNWQATAEANVKLKGEVYLGFGICDSDCDGDFCGKKKTGGEMTFGLLKLSVGTDGVKVMPPF